MQQSIPHPYNQGSRIFLPYDSVHVFKCTYNNFLNKKWFRCPNFDGPGFIEPDVGHIQQLYDYELGRPLKYAHKLTDKVLHPMPIQKTNVDLADRFYHESTIDALEYYSENGFPHFKPTAKYLRIIRTWWNIVNCKNPSFGKRTRDPVREPISIDDPGGIQYLEKVLKWIKKWEEMENGRGFSSETFITFKQTTHGLIGVAIYLLEEKGLGYVLLAFIGSDPIEGRYGWYRQLSGKFLRSASVCCIS